MAKFHKLFKWLSNEISESEDGQYRHRLLKERLEYRSGILGGLRAFVHNAHEDSRHHLRSLAGMSLDPLGKSSANDPAEGYPERLNIEDLKAYFGEIFAGLIAEYLSPFGYDWKVPAFLFRFHNVAFQRLEMVRQTGEEAKKVPGRQGDDCLAFQLDGEGRIIRSLACEAKCTIGHDLRLISGAHKKVSEANAGPVDIPKLIEILKDYNDSDSSQWVDSLRQLWLRDPRELRSLDSDYERCDLVSYVCGRSPVRGDRRTWIPTEAPHDEYTAGRRLEAIETHLHDIRGLVQEVYRKKDDENAWTE